MSSLHVRRAAAACAATTALLAAGALPAATAHDHKDDKHVGYVNVCQKISYPDPYAKYHGEYRVEDQKDYWNVDLYGDYDCYRVTVKKGWVTVKVTEQPAYTKLYGRSYVKVYVDKGEYKTVKFSYDAKKYDFAG